MSVGGAALASVQWVDVDSARHCVEGTINEGAALASVPSVGVGPASHCVGVNGR
jgi:hypothetical protein